MTAGNILVCVDGSDYTEPSLRHAAWLGDRVGACRLIVSHIADVGKYQVPFVNELGAGIGLQPCNGLFREIQKQEQEMLESLKQRVAHELNEAGWHGKYELVIERGRPEEALAATGITYSHVVFGKRGESFSYDQEHLGSNLGKFLKHSAVPCFLSSRKYQAIKKVALIFADDQDWESVVHFAESLTDMASLQFHLIHTFSQAVPKELSTLYESLFALNSHTQFHELSDSHEHVIIAKVREINADLLVVGANQESHFFQWLASPLGKSVIKECRIPIILSRDLSS